jgi:hypothetical protein
MGTFYQGNKERQREVLWEMLRVQREGGEERSERTVKGSGRERERERERERCVLKP